MSLRALRKRRGWTQGDLARRSGVCLRTVLAVEHGRVCRQNTKRLLCRAVGVPWRERGRVFGGTA